MTPLCLLHAWESTQRESIQYKIHTQCPYLAYKTSKQEKPLPGYAHAMPMPTWKAVAWWRMYIVQGYTLGFASHKQCRSWVLAHMQQDRSEWRCCSEQQ